MYIETKFGILSDLGAESLIIYPYFKMDDVKFKMPDGYIKKLSSCISWPQLSNLDTKFVVLRDLEAEILIIYLYLKMAAIKSKMAAIKSKIADVYI